MSVYKTAFFSQINAVFLAFALLAACGGDDDNDTSTGGKTSNTKSSGGSGGTGADTGASGAAGTTAGTAGTAGTTRGTAGGGGFAGMFVQAECTEEAPTEPVICNNVSCAALTAGLMGSSCIYACCTASGTCGAKDTQSGYETACQTQPPIADSRCPDVASESRSFAGAGGGAAGATGAAGNGSSTTLKGCCTPDNKCGVISTNRNLCVTKSRSASLPETPKSCDGT
jgi:hypothetical protein